MKFFLPDISDAQTALEAYQACRLNCEKQTGTGTLPRRIFCVRYRHDGVEHIAAVGRADYSEGIVTCIFETPAMYLVCTRSRGFPGGFPILVGKDKVSDIEDFFEDQ